MGKPSRPGCMSTQCHETDRIEQPLKPNAQGNVRGPAAFVALCVAIPGKTTASRATVLRPATKDGSRRALDTPEKRAIQPHGAWRSSATRPAFQDGRVKHVVLELFRLFRGNVKTGEHVTLLFRFDVLLL